MYVFNDIWINNLCRQEFVVQLGKCSNINLFLGELSDVDVTTTMYKELRQVPKLVSGGKVS